VIGNPAYGPDSDLYGAMGYVRLPLDGPGRFRGKSQRKSGLTQKSNVPSPTPSTLALFAQSTQETRALLQNTRAFLSWKA
jgi:hypothetical protein